MSQCPQGIRTGEGHPGAHPLTEMGNTGLKEAGTHPRSPCLTRFVPGALAIQPFSQGGYPRNTQKTVLPTEVPAVRGQDEAGAILWGGPRLLPSLQTLSNLGPHDQSCPLPLGAWGARGCLSLLPLLCPSCPAHRPVPAGPTALTVRVMPHPPCAEGSAKAKPSLRGWG